MAKRETKKIAFPNLEFDKPAKHDLSRQEPLVMRQQNVIREPVVIKETVVVQEKAVVVEQTLVPGTVTTEKTFKSFFDEIG